MNRIFDEFGKELKTVEDFNKAAGFPWGDKYPYELSRITGNACYCNGDGVFDLLPKNDIAVIEGGKRYMFCRKCGCSSHL